MQMQPNSHLVLHILCTWFRLHSFWPRARLTWSKEYICSYLVSNGVLNSLVLGAIARDYGLFWVLLKLRRLPHATHKGALNNYVDRILTFFAPPPLGAPTWTIFIHWACSNTDIFWPPPPSSCPRIYWMVTKRKLKTKNFELFLVTEQLGRFLNLSSQQYLSQISQIVWTV